MRLFIQKGDDRYEIQPDMTVWLPSATTDVSGITMSVAADIDSVIDTYSGSEYVTAINDVQSDDQGDFLIEGSDCVSWTYTDQTIEDITLNNGLPVHGAILLTDMCPTCTKCENIYSLMYEFENMKLWINMLKDVNLYDLEDTKTRYLNLKDLRVTSPISPCGVYPADDTILKGTQLFKEYVTMLHMWNYVVSINNYSSTIQIAPEDTAGFVVQTKHSVTTCGDNNTVKVGCTVDACIDHIISGSTKGIPTDYNKLSVYIPPDSMHFSYGPMETGGDGFLPIAGSTVTVTTARQTDPTAIAGAATIKHLESVPHPYQVDKAGTFMMEAKFLPFIPSETKVSGSDVVITTDNWVDVVGATALPSGGGEADYSVITTTYGAVDSPVASQYLNSGIAPAAAMDISIVWNIQVRWDIWENPNSDTPTRQESQSFVYKCNGVSAPCGKDLSWTTDIDKHDEPEPPNGTNVSQ